MNQNNINIYGIPEQQQIYQQNYDNTYQGYNNSYNTSNNYYAPFPEKNLSIRAESFVPSSFLGRNNSYQSPATNIPSKAPQNSFSNITEESINEYLENFKKMKQNNNKKESEKEKEIVETTNEINKDKLREINSEDKNIPNGGNGTNLNVNSCQNSNDYISTSESNETCSQRAVPIENSPLTSSFLFNDNEISKKMASASLSYYFDFHHKNGKNLKLNLLDNCPYKTENSEKLKLFEDNEEDNLIYNTAKIIDIKSESEDDAMKYQNYFGPHRSK
jgi:hypothetical protein